MGSFNFMLYIGAALVIIAAFLGLMNIAYNNLTETRQSVEDLKEIMDQKQSSINITSIMVNSRNLSVYVENTGKHKLSPENIDVYLDARIPRNDTIIDILVDRLNPNLIDPNEDIKITVLRGAVPNNTYTLTVNDEFGAKDSIEFYYNTQELTVDNGQYNPDTGDMFNNGELIAINNDEAGRITLYNFLLDPDQTRAGLEMSNISKAATQIEVIIDYTGLYIEDNEFKVELRNASYDGYLYCSDNFGYAENDTTVSILCMQELSAFDVDNLYVHCINQGNESNEDAWVDYVKVNVTSLIII